jgi:hypothetical protein
VEGEFYGRKVKWEGVFLFSSKISKKQFFTKNNGR